MTEGRGMAALARRRPHAFKTRGDGEFEGYASLFDRADQGHDVVQRGAFRDTLLKRGASGVRMLFQHDPNQPVGQWLSLLEDDVGLRVRGKLLQDVQRGREIFALMRAGALDGLSIGFKTIRARRDRARRQRRLLSVDLWEISIVTFPMLDTARVSSVKRHGKSWRDLN